jgi:RNA polymerase sigma-70 factor (ECF subfamily)
VALNTALYFLRTKSRIITERVEDLNIDLPIDEQANELMDRLKEMIEQLKPFDKSLLMLHLDGLSYKEIAEITGLSVTNVGTRLNRIREKLKKISTQKVKQ